jgi:hypothetical protein
MMKMTNAAIAAVLIVGAIAHAEDNKLPCTSPLPSVAAVCACLKKEAPYGDKCEAITDGKTPSGQAVRAGGLQGASVYAVAKQPSGWAVVDRLLYEQHHGKRASSLSMVRASESTIAGRVVVRFDYTTSDDVAGNDNDSQTQTETSALCAIGASCIHVDTACKGEDGDANGSFKGALSVDAATGAVSVTGKHEGSPKVCAPPLGPLSLWGGDSQAPPDAFASAVACTVAQPKAHFYSDAGEPRAAYVQQGDRVDAMKAPAPLSADFVRARFKGSKKATIGFMKKTDLSCAAGAP